MCVCVCVMPPLPPATPAVVSLSLMLLILLQFIYQRVEGGGDIPSYCGLVLFAIAGFSLV